MLCDVWCCPNQDGSSKWLIYCKQCRSNCYFCYFLNNPIVSLILLSLSLKYSWKSSLVSKIISRCLWIADWMSSVSWKLNHGSFDLLIFLEKITFWACFLGSRLKFIFHWNVHLFIFFRSSFKFCAGKVTSWTTEKSKVSSGSSLGFETNLSEKSLINIKKKRGPKLDPWGTPALRLAH